MSLLATIRRNPVVAALSAALIVSIVVGTTCSIYFALPSQRAEQSLNDANQALKAREAELAAAHDKLLGTLARSMLRDRIATEITEAEIAELGRLANQQASEKDPSKP